MRFIWILLFITSLIIPATARAADFDRGVDAYGQGDYDLAFAEWLPLAETNDLAAQYNIALLLEYGLGVERDLNQAIEWYSRAAESGYASAQVRIGDFYQSGVWGHDRMADAIEWYQLAAEQGDDDAIQKLSTLGIAPRAPRAEPRVQQAFAPQPEPEPLPGQVMGGASCPVRNGRDFDVNVKISIPRPPINHNLSSAQLTEKSFHGPNARVLGLTVPKLQIQTRVEHATEKRDGHYCYWLEGVQVQLIYKSIEVYVAREYKRGSCEYKAVLRHEQEHVAIARRNLEKFKPKVRHALTSLLLPTPDRPIKLASSEQNEEALQSLLARILDPVYQEMQEDLERAQAAIDTPESYAKVRAQCSNW